jgi:hypothetical protein
MELLNKPVSKELTKRLDYSNLLGLDEELKNGRYMCQGSYSLF